MNKEGQIRFSVEPRVQQIRFRLIIHAQSASIRYPPEERARSRFLPLNDTVTEIVLQRST